MADESTAEPQAARAPVLLPDVTVRCAKCGYHGPAEPRAPGKLWLEAVFWIAFMIPGVVYSIWRLFWRKYLCPQCKSADQQVVIAPARRVAMLLRAVLLVVFVACVLAMLMLWNLPGEGAG